MIPIIGKCVTIDAVIIPDSAVITRPREELDSTHFHVTVSAQTRCILAEMMRLFVLRWRLTHL